MKKAKGSKQHGICADGKPIDKSVLDRWRALSAAERADMTFLISQGFPPEQARALAMAGTGTTSRQGVPRKKSAIAKADFARAFIDEAKEHLPAGLHAQIHARARARVGGLASGQSRRAAKDAKADAMLKAHKLLKKLMVTLAKGPKSIDKVGPLISEILNGGAPKATPGVIGPQLSPKDRIDKLADEMAFDAIQTVTHVTKGHVTASMADDFIDDAFSHSASNDDFDSSAYDPKEVAQFLDSQRLVRGIDVERLGESISVADARQRASRNLARNMGHYDSALGDDRDLNYVGGLNIDLGSGMAREVGYLGIDTYPYDHGTIIHDVGLGIPFPSGSGRCIRLVGALDEMTDFADDPTPLLEEVQRVLGIGGKLIYQGTKPLLLDKRRLVGLEVESEDVAEPPDPQMPNIVRAVIKRVPAMLPLVYGADPQWLSAQEERYDQVQEAQRKFGEQPLPEIAMANLVHKAEHVEVYQPSNVLKADKHQQIVTGVVLAPDEVDSQDDTMSAEEIEKTAHQFLIDARVVGNEHASPMPGARVIESFIAPVDISYAGDDYGPQIVKKGSWVLSVKVAEPKHWAEVLDGNFTGFSVGGYGKRDAA